MQLQVIRDHLSSARIALGQSHSLYSRIFTIERNLTPGDARFRNDAVSAETDLLWVSTAIERMLLSTPRRPALPDLNEALKKIAEAQLL